MLDTYILINGSQRIDSKEISTIKIEYSISDIRNYGSKNASKSRKFSIIKNDNTRKIFGSLFDTSNIGGFNTSIKTRCSIIENGIEILTGYIYVDYINENEDYECLVISDEFNLIKTLGDKLIRGNEDPNLDLTWYHSGYPPFNHTFNVTTVANIINNPITTPDGSGYIYPFIDYDGRLSNKTTDSLLGTNPLRNNYPLFPALYAKQIFDKIFEDNGYTYELSSSVESILNKIIIPWNEDYTQYTVDYNYATYKPGTYQGPAMGTIWSNLGSVTTSSGPMDYVKNDHASAVYDKYTGSWAPNGTLRYYRKQSDDYLTQFNYDPSGINSNFPFCELPHKGTFHIDCSILAWTVGTDTQTALDIITYSKGEGVKTFSLGTLNASSGFITSDASCDVTINERSYFVITQALPDEGSPQTIYILYDNTSFDITEKNSWFGSGHSFNINNMTPVNYKQADFLNDIFKMFNLYIEVDKLDPYKIYLKPPDDFYTDKVFDWTSKFIEGKFKKLKEILPGNFKFEMNQDSDIYSKDYNSKRSRYLFENSVENDSEFYTSDETVKLNFAPTAYGPISGISSGYNVSKINDDNNVIKNNWKPRLLIEDVGNPSSTYWGSKDTLLNYFPTAVPFDNTSYTEISAPIFLGWYSSDSYAPSPSTITQHNLFNKFYRDRLYRDLDDNAKFVTAKFYLTSKDIYEVNFGDKIYLDNDRFKGYYRLNRIIYQPGEIAEVELIKEVFLDTSYSSSATKGVIYKTTLGSVTSSGTGSSSSGGSGSPTTISDYYGKSYIDGSLNLIHTIDNNQDTSIYNNAIAIAALGNPESLYQTVRNETGSSIPAGRAVYISGFNNIPLIALGDNTDFTKHEIIGVTTAAISNESNGQIISHGLLDNLAAVDTLGNVGDKLYLSTSGQLTTTVPTSGAIIQLGIITESDDPGSILLFDDKSFDHLDVTSGQDIGIRMGDSAGANKVNFKDYANNVVADIDSDGTGLFTKLRVNQDVSIASFTNFDSSVMIRGKLRTNLDSSFGGFVNLDSSLMIRGKFRVNQDVSISGFVNLDSSLMVRGKLRVNQDVSIGANLNSESLTSEYLYIDGDASITDTLYVDQIYSSDISINNNLDVKQRIQSDSLYTDLIQSSNYTPGQLLGTGFKFEAKTENATGILDEINIRKTLRASNLEISTTTVTNGPHLFSLSTTADSSLLYDASLNSVYFIANGVLPFVEDDFIFSQSMDVGNSGLPIYRTVLKVNDVSDNRCYVTNAETNVYDKTKSPYTAIQINPTIGYSGFKFLTYQSYITLFTGKNLIAGDYTFEFFDKVRTSTSSITGLTLAIYDSSNNVIDSSTLWVDTDDNCYTNVIIDQNYENCSAKIYRNAGFEKNLEFDAILDYQWPKYKFSFENTIIDLSLNVFNNTFAWLGNKTNGGSLIYVIPNGDESPSINYYDNCYTPYLDPSSLKLATGNISGLKKPDGTTSSGIGIWTDNAVLLSDQSYISGGTIGGFKVNQKSIQSIGDSYMNLSSEGEISIVKDTGYTALFISDSNLSNVNDFSFTYKNLNYKVDIQDSCIWTIDSSVLVYDYGHTQDPSLYLYYSSIDSSLRYRPRSLYKQYNNLYIQPKDASGNNDNWQINKTLQTGKYFFNQEGNNCTFNISLYLNREELIPNSVPNPNDVGGKLTIQFISDSGDIIKSITKSNLIFDYRSLNYLINFSDSFSSYNNFYIKILFEIYYFNEKYILNSWPSLGLDDFQQYVIPWYSILIPELSIITNLHSNVNTNEGITQISTSGIQTIYDANNYFRVDNSIYSVCQIKGGLQVDSIIASDISSNISGNVTGNVTGNLNGTFTVANEPSDTTCYPLFVTATTGNLAPKTNTNLTFNSATGDLQATNMTISDNLNLGTYSNLNFGTYSDLNFGTYSDLNLGASSDIKMGSGSTIIFNGSSATVNSVNLNPTSGNSYLNGRLFRGSNDLGPVMTINNTDDTTTLNGNLRRGLDIVVKEGYGGTTYFQRFYEGTTAEGFIYVTSAGVLGFFQESDRNLKKNIVPTEKDALTLINNLEVVDFDWKNEKKDQRRGRQIGLIAQQALSQIPDMVSLGENYLGVSYEPMHPYYIKAIQQLSEENKKLKEGYEDLLKRIEKLEKK